MGIEHLAVLIPHVAIVATFVTVALIVFWSVKSGDRRRKFEHEERMLAIEKGVEIPMTPPKKRNSYSVPFVLGGIGLAIVIGGIFIGIEDWIWGLVAMFIGGGMLAAHFLNEKIKKKKEDETMALTESQETHKLS